MNAIAMLDSETGLVRIDSENRLYVIACGDGYSHLGFDVCEKRTRDYATTLDRPDLMPQAEERGTIEGFRRHHIASEALRVSGKRCLAGLVPQLVGLEGKRVEVIDCYDEKRRFYVGRSTGWYPCHLEIKLRTSHGGGAVTGAPFKSVRVVGER